MLDVRECENGGWFVVDPEDGEPVKWFSTEKAATAFVKKCEAAQSAYEDT